jgi:O-antigen/teichoic acid export membrane protein
VTLAASSSVEASAARGAVEASAARGGLGTLGALLVRALVGSAWLRLVGMGLSFLVGAQLTRALGLAGYGVYGVAMSILALLTVPTELGMPQLLTREAATARVTNDWGRLRGALAWATQTSLAVSAVTAVVLVAGLFALGHGLDSPLSKTLLVGLAMAPIAALGNLRGAALRGLQFIVRGQVPDLLVRPGLYSLLLFGASLAFAPLTPFVAMSLGVVSAAASLVFAASLLRLAAPPEVRTAEARARAREWLRDCVPMALTEGMRVLQGHLTVLVVGLLASDEETGIFRVASSAALLVATPISLFDVVAAPILAGLSAQGERARTQRMLTWVAVGMTALTALLSLPFVFAGEALLTLLFGAGVGVANPALLALCVSVVINGFFGANAVLLNMSGHQQRVTRASAISVAVLALASPPLIGLAGSLGAAGASVLSMAVWNVILWRDARERLGVDTSLLSVSRGMFNA